LERQKLPAEEVNLEPGPGSKVRRRHSFNQPILWMELKLYPETGPGPGKVVYHARNSQDQVVLGSGLGSLVGICC
jgi:hypothetical protein